MKTREKTQHNKVWKRIEKHIIIINIETSTLKELQPCTEPNEGIYYRKMKNEYHGKMVKQKQGRKRE